MFIFIVLLLIGIPIALYWLRSAEIFDTIIKCYGLVIESGALITLVLLFLQSCIMRKHKQTSIDMQKSYKAIDLMYRWANDSTAEMLLARKIVDKMKDSEVKKLSDGNEAVIISNEDYMMLKGFLPKEVQKQTEQTNKMTSEQDSGNLSQYSCQYAEKCEVANSQRLSTAETLWLRSWIVKYLNLLEVIMYAWKAGAVNKRIVEKEFGYLVQTERDGSVVLEKYRKFSGQENYPGIYSFCIEMGKRNQKTIETMDIQG